MKSKSLAIGLLTDRIDVVLCAGAQVVDGRRIQITLEQDSGKWARQVRDAAKAVRAAAQEMGAVGLGARVLYHGPGACAEYVSPRAKTAAEASSAAILTCADSLSCPLDSAAARASIVSFEKHDQQPRAHVVVAADGDDALSAICEMVEQAGLKFTSATPLDAALMMGVAHHATDVSAASAVATLYFGEHRSFLVIANQRSVVFARPISVGLDALVTSLTRPLRLAGGQSVEINRETARAIIHDCGFPSRSQVVHEQLELTGGQVVPVLQPVLQRFMVEVRQSLRFALPEGQRQSVRLRLLGPGSRTPGFTQIIADELGVSVEPDEAYQGFDYRKPATSGSEIADALTWRRGTSNLALEPLALSRHRRMRHMQRWLWIGAAAALGMIVMDHLRFNERLARTRKEVEALHTEKEGQAALKATADKLLAGANAISSLDNLVRRETGARVCMGTVLQELSRLTPPSVRLFSVSFRPAVDGMISGSIGGYAMDDPTHPGSTSRLLESYIQTLGASPLLSHLALANVQATVLEKTPAQTFDVSFDAIAAPVEDLSIAAPFNASTSADAGSADKVREHQP